MRLILKTSVKSPGVNRPNASRLKTLQIVDEAIVDANVLLRLLVDESPEIALRVSMILDAASERDITLLVSALTFAEVVYVLESVYKWDRDTIADKLSELIETSELERAA